MMRLAVRTLPPPTLTYEDSVALCLAYEGRSRLGVIHIRVTVSFFDIFLSLIVVGFQCLTLKLCIVAQPGESEEVADVELCTHAFASCILALWHSLQIAAYTPTFGQGAQ